ncbi:MAG: restriction endonuclease subunit R, partial [Deltaproteobacteria bacterium]|nr:restriction endonuclease subunit R [Deltaproteobacteria bacterium]
MRCCKRLGCWSEGRAQLLEYWLDPDRDRRFFFCQIEAVETAIYLLEAADKHNTERVARTLQESSREAASSLYRVAFKMATGSGKTVVMAMIIAWQVLNRLANPQDKRFSDAFLIVAPGITIRDRLRVLLPEDPQNFYRQRDVVTNEQLEQLRSAKIVITNFHGFLRREKISAGKLTKAILSDGKDDAFVESPDEMVRRVCRGMEKKRNIVVINDEAHHCYRSKPVADDEAPIKGAERKEAEQREEEARIWLSGLEAVKKKLGIRMVYDLSATPFFLRGSGYREGTLFPWVVSDFSLIDAIESGIVKVPRVPVEDDQMTGDMPTYRDLWGRIREHLPKKSLGDSSGREPNLPKDLQGALYSLYGNYEKYHRSWESASEAREKGQTAPVFIVVCNNTSVSKLVYDFIAGWEKPLPDGSSVVVPGEFAIFSNVDGDRWRRRPK